MKYLLLLVVLWVAYALWRAKRGAGRGPSGGASDGAPNGTAARSAPSAPQDMVRCPVCSLHLPRGEAITDSQGRQYCSAQHRDQAPR